MLVLATSALDPVSDAIDGIEFGRFGGNSTWDFSASRGTNPDGIGGPGMIAVTGLANGWKVDLLDKNGNVKASATAGAGGFVNLDLYAANIRAFPMRGQFRVYSPGPTLEYVSPMFENLWGGDKFAYGNPGFYPNGDLLTVSSTVHNRAIGTLEFQTGRGASPQVPQKIFTKYDGLGFSVETKRSHNAAWISTSRTRDGYGNAVTVTDPRNHLTTYQYSPSVCSSAYVWKKIQIVGGQTTTAQSSYDCGTGLVIQSTNPRGYASDFTYDGVGRLLTVTYPAVAGVRDQVSYAYDDTLRTVTFFDELNDRARDGYDAFGRRISTQRLRDDGSVYSDATATYNWQGQIASQNSPEGVTTTYAYDLLGRLVKSTNDDGTHVDVAYQDTASGQRRTVTDEENHKRDFVYDLDGRVLQVTEYVGLTPYTTQYTYDDVGNLLSVADARSPPETTTQSYDDLNRVLQTNYPDSTVLVASYDENGNVIGRTDGTGSGVFTYDELNRLTNADYGNGLLVFDYAYDKNSNLVHSGTGGDPARGAPLGATVDYAYDERDRVSQEMTAVFFDSSVVCGPAIPSAAEVRTFSFGWTPDSNLAQLTYPDGRVVLYQYDDFDRPIVVPGIADSLGYNKDDQLTSLQFAHPVGVPAWLGEYTYDSRGRLASINYKKDSVSQLLMTYTYFSNSNIQQIINGGSLETFTYDTRERLTQATGSWGTTTYGYDEVGNRLTTTDAGVLASYTYGAYNRLVSTQVASGPTTNYAYDGNGNVLTKTILPSDTWTFVSDPANRLTAVKHPGSTTVQCHGFDAGGRRFRVESPSSGTRLRELWAGDHLMAEENIVSGATTDYVYAGSRLIARMATGDSFFYLQDHLGSTRRVVQKSTGGVVFSASYKPFGVEIPGTGTEGVRYIQRQWDPSIGLSYLVHRFFDPQLGRFLSRDPLLGRLSRPLTQNRYVYAVNNPVRFSDPNGLSHDVPWWADLLTLGLASQIPDTIEWWGKASDAERWGFVAGIAVAVGIGILIGLSCVFAGCVGLVALALGSVAFLAGSTAAALTYIGVTRALGGTPTQEGVSHAFYWGGWAGIVGFSIGGMIGTAAHNARLPDIDMGPRISAADENPGPVFRIGRSEGRWWSSKPFENMEGVEAEFGPTSRSWWRPTYRMSGYFGEDVVYQAGPRGATGAFQFRAFSGEPVIASRVLYALAPGVIATAAGAVEIDLAYFLITYFLL